MFKDLLYTGMGAAAILREKVEEEMKHLEERGKIKKDDARSFLDSIKERGAEEEYKKREKLKDMLKEIIDELGLATKEDLEKLKEERQ